MNEIFWSQKARKQLLKITAKEAKVIFINVAELENFPSCKNVKKLSHHKHKYRMRVGQYRILFNHDGKVKIISIEEVKKRDERTY